MFNTIFRWNVVIVRTPSLKCHSHCISSSLSVIIFIVFLSLRYYLSFSLIVIAFSFYLSLLWFLSFSLPLLLYFLLSLCVIIFLSLSLCNYNFCFTWHIISKICLLPCKNYNLREWLLERLTMTSAQIISTILMCQNIVKISKIDSMCS